MTKATYRIAFIWGLLLQRIRVHDHDGGKRGNGQIGVVLKQWLRAEVSRYNHEVEGETPGMLWVFWNLKAHSQWHTSSNMAMPPDPSPTVPATGDQVFKYKLLGAILIHITTGMGRAVQGETMRLVPKSSFDSKHFFFFYWPQFYLGNNLSKTPN